MPYTMVWLTCGGKKRYLLVHCLVLLAFVGPCPPGMECCHWDRDRHNCNLSNLRYGTKAENQADKERHGTVMRGVKNGTAKLTESQVIEIRGLAASGLDQTVIGDRYGITQAAVSSINTRKTWKHI